jgi:hypothetical protein
MAMIYVKARPGRSIPYEGRMLPNDKFVAVGDTPYIRGLINRWDDLEVQGDLPKGGAKKSTPKSVSETRPISTAKNTTVANEDPAPGTGAPPKL